MKTSEFAITFDNLKKVANIANILMWLSAALMLAETFTEKKQFVTATNYIVVTNCFILVVFQALSFFRELLQFKAEQLKRLDLYDNSFGTKLSETHTEGYYSNE